MNRFIIISGGSIEDEAIKLYLWDEMGETPDVQKGTALDTILKKNDIGVIVADAGLRFCFRNHLIPDVVVGDFDSIDRETLLMFKEEEGIVWYELNPEKDDTDTEFAIRTALKMGAEKITIIGGTGSRLDHVLGNIELLGIGIEEGVPIELVDSHNRIRMIKEEITLQREKQFGKYVSLIPYTERVEHLTLEGFKYLLTDECLKGFCSLGISNEIVEAEAKISFEGGILLVIESSDFGYGKR